MSGGAEGEEDLEEGGGDCAAVEVAATRAKGAEVGEADEEGGGFSGELLLAEAEHGRAEIGGRIGERFARCGRTHCVRRAEFGGAGGGVEVLEDGGEGADNGVELCAGDEAGAPGGGGIDGVEALADVGTGHPEREGFDGGVVGFGESLKGEGRVDEGGDEGVGGGLIGAEEGWGLDGRGGHGWGECTVFVWCVKLFVWVLYCKRK